MSLAQQRDLKLAGLALLVMAMLAALHGSPLDLPWLHQLELAALDAQVRWRGPSPPGPETVVVMIDDRSIADIGRWPIPRPLVAELVSRLHAGGAKAIGMDVLFADPDPPARGSPAAESGEATLARAMADAGNVALAFTFRFGARSGVDADPSLALSAYPQLHRGPGYRPLGLRPTGVLLPVAPLTPTAALGHVLVAYDIDGAPRYDYPVLEFDADYYPSLAVRLAQLFLGVPWREVRVELGQGIALGAVYVPTDASMRMLVDYRGPPRTFATYPLSQVLSGAVPGSMFRDKLVLVGADALGSRDTFRTPFTSVMPGVERLATLVDSILHERHLRRPPGMAWLEVAVMLGGALTLALAVSRLPLALAAFAAVGMITVLIAASQIALRSSGLWLDAGVPSVALVLTFIALSLYRYGLLDKERRHIRRVFQRYLAPRMVDRVVNDQKLAELGGEERELTVMFCDLRGFTALSERLEPPALVQLANRFFALATEAVLEHNGTVDKYLGDAIMAFWNAPTDQPDHAQLACRAALRIADAVAASNATLAPDSAEPRLAVSIGINTGMCTVGNFGSAHRFDYSAIGDPVNVAARLEAETKKHGVTILLGPETAARLEAETKHHGVTILPGREIATRTGRFVLHSIGCIHLRGRSEALEAYALVGAEDAAAPR